MKNRLPRGLRLNNPCCLTHSQSEWQGKSADQPDPKFVKFDTLAYGYRAAFKLLNRYHYWYKLQTAHDIMHRFAPTYDNNNTQLYIDIICRYLSPSILRRQWGLSPLGGAAGTSSGCCKHPIRPQGEGEKAPDLSRVILPAPPDDQNLWSRFLTIITKVEQGIDIKEVDQEAIAEGYRMAFGK